ncbi:TRADD-N-associated membrane domain-containing protein, partial [Vibrio cholerae]
FIIQIKIDMGALLLSIAFESLMNIEIIGTMIGAAAAISSLKSISEYIKSRQVSKQIAEAEERAFRTTKPNSQDATKKSPTPKADSETNDEEMKKLLNLYTKQVEGYQHETRRRASSSFFFAILSMIGGLVFIFWGGSFILSAEGADHTIAGASVSAIGGGISAYITKSFLEVHKLSLTQLNRYFKQPVINEHILMAQRLANDVNDPSFKRESYEKLINSINHLITEANTNQQ